MLSNTRNNSNCKIQYRFDRHTIHLVLNYIVLGVPMYIICQNTNSQVQGENNGVSLDSDQNCGDDHKDKKDRGHDGGRDGGNGGYGDGDNIGYDEFIIS